MEQAKGKTIGQDHIATYLDHLDGHCAFGWVCDTQDPQRTLAVEVVVDQEVKLTVQADHYRADLKEQGLSEGYSGFNIVFPAEWADDQEHEVILRVRDAQQHITPQPVSIRFSAPVSHKQLVGSLDYVSTDPGREHTNLKNEQLGQSASHSYK